MNITDTTRFMAQIRKLRLKRLHELPKVNASVGQSKDRSPGLTDSKAWTVFPAL